MVNKIYSNELFQIHLPVPPEIEMVSSSPVEVGEDSTLICQASGRPRPKIYWTRKGGETIGNIYVQSLLENKQFAFNLAESELLILDYSDGAKTIELADADGVQRSQGTSTSR